MVRQMFESVMYLKSRTIQQDVSRLGDVGGVQAVVVGNVLQVVILQGHQKADENVARNFELLHQITFLERKENCNFPARVYAVGSNEPLKRCCLKATDKLAFFVPPIFSYLNLNQ
jgi:hypothetical protein